MHTHPTSDWDFGSQLATNPCPSFYPTLRCSARTFNQPIMSVRPASPIPFALMKQPGPIVIVSTSPASAPRRASAKEKELKAENRKRKDEYAKKKAKAKEFADMHNKLADDYDAVVEKQTDCLTTRTQR